MAWPMRAHSDHADGAVTERRDARRRVAIDPLAVPQKAFLARQFAHRAQEQPQRGVSNLLGQHVRRVGDSNAVRASPGGVDMAVADPEGGDDFEFWQPGKEVRRHPLVDAAHRDGPGCARPRRREAGSLRGAADLVQNEGTGQPVDENRLGRADEKRGRCRPAYGAWTPPFGLNLTLDFAPHNSLLHHTIIPTGCSMNSVNASNNCAPERHRPPCDRRRVSRSSGR